MDDARVRSEQLIAEMGWVRQLARALIKDPASADDVAQDTWIVAAERAPDTEQPVRPWLARVVKNLVHTRRRSDARRKDRDTAFDDGRAVRTPAELVERVELQRAVADEVLALGEPYRSTVLLHFVDGHSSAEIARRLGIPDGTVRRRLKVALDQLREGLARRTDAPARGWLAALVPFARANVSPPARAAIGVIAMKKIAAIALCLLVLLAAGVVAVSRHRAATRDVAKTASPAMADHVARAAGARHDDDSARVTAVPGWIPQGGPARRRIAGHVVFQGRPVGGARVTLGFEAAGEVAAMRTLAAGAPAGILQHIAEVRSGSDGAFDFGLQPAAVFVVSASAEDHATGVVPVDNANLQVSADHLTVSLGSCEHRLSGLVADASGGPIARAAISVDGADGAYSGTDGAYQVCLSPKVILGMPTVDVRVEADGYGTIHEAVLAVGDMHHDFALVPEAVLVGRVMTKTGDAVEGARVVAHAEPQEIPRHVASAFTYADKDGRFRIARLAPGAFQLAAEAAGGRTSPISVFARPATTSREIQLVLDATPVARVRGHVYKANVPTGGVQIQAIHDGGPAGGTVSLADGSFAFDALPYGKVQFFASPNGTEPSTQLDIARPDVDDVRIDVKKAARIHGHVTRKGAPVPGADVTYLAPPQASFYGAAPATKADAKGAFSLDVPAGAGQLYASDYSKKAFTFRPVELTADEDKTVDLELDSAGEVQGVVVNESGAPVAGVYMRLDIADGSGDMCESMTDDSGRFDCALLVGGEYRATVTPSPGARRAFAPAHGASFDPIQVPRDGVITGVQLAIKDERFAIRGTVVDDTGAPISDVHVMAMAPGESTMDFPSTLTDSAGRFEIGGLARGTYSLRAHAADGSDGVVPDVAAGTTAVPIKLTRAGVIEGTLAGFEGGATVFFWSLDAGPPQSGRALVQGATFSRAGVAPGRYMIEATAGADADAVTVEVHAGETVHVDLHRRAVGSVEGTVADLATRKPLAAMRCDAKPSLAGQTTPMPPDVAFQAFTDAAGHFEVAAPVGRVRIFCFPPNGGSLGPAGTDVDVTAARPATVSVFSVASSTSPSDAGFSVGPDLPVTARDVVPGGPAATAGLHAGDQIVSVDGLALQGVLPQGAMALVTNHRPGTAATLGIVGAQGAQTIKVVVTGAGP